MTGMLFSQEPRGGQSREHIPLAARLRPKTSDEFLGHRQIIEGQGILAELFDSGKLRSSLIFWGPPGSGKTTLAHLVAAASDSTVHTLSAVTAGVADLRKVVQQSKEQPGPHLLFIDEIHRFNKAQQDALLPTVENGQLRLLGATTENPYFELRKALLSRCRVVRLEKHSEADIVKVLERALNHPDGFGRSKVEISSEVLNSIAKMADGDARSSLNLLEMAVARGSYTPEGSIRVSPKNLQALASEQHLGYNRDSDRRYDLTSAFIKSIRGSDPDASLYWLACMLEGGEDPKYIFRRLLISAAEDVGMADPSAIAVVNSCASAFEWVGLPEGKYHLSQATLYLATANKSSSVAALFSAEKHLKRTGPLPVPAHLRDGTYSGAKEHGIGQGYQHPLSTGAKKQRYLPKQINEGTFYRPGNLGYERTIRQRLGIDSSKG